MGAFKHREQVRPQMLQECLLRPPTKLTDLWRLVSMQALIKQMHLRSKAQSAPFRLEGKTLLHLTRLSRKIETQVAQAARKITALTTFDRVTKPSQGLLELHPDKLIVLFCHNADIFDQYLACVSTGPPKRLALLVSYD